MSSGYEVVDEAIVGGNEQVASEWKTVRVTFRNFAELPSKRGDLTESSVLECHGLRWTIQLYPGGNTASSEDKAHVSIFLNCVSCSKGNSIRAAYQFRIPPAGKSMGLNSSNLSTYSTKFQSLGFKDYALRSVVLDPPQKYLVGDDLTVEVDIQVMLDKPPTWKPTNTVCSDMLNLLDAACYGNSDVIFQTESGKEGAKKGKKTASHIFYAHRAILSARCPTLEALAEDCSPATPIPIEDVEPDMFRMLLRFIYGGEVPSTEVLKSEGRSIIRAADEYGCTGLKLAAESELASAGITTENAAELILFADGTNCAMLKEAAMDYFVKNAQDVMSSEGFEQVAESPAIMREMMAVGFGGSKKRPAPSDADAERDYKRMRVASLRQKLDEKKLDVDGSKEMLVSRLEAADAEEQAAAQAAAQAEAENEESDENDS